MTAAQKLDDYAKRLSIPNEIDWKQYEIPQSEAAKIREASEYQEEVRKAFLGEEASKGLTLPWAKATDFRFRDGEMTLWTGYNGHKKSMMMGQVMLGLIAQYTTCCIASLEMKPWKSLKRLARQFVGVQEPAEPAQDDFFQWAQGSMWFYDQVGTVDPKRMIAVSRFAITELGIKHMVIDSLMKCGINEDDLNTQKWFVNELQTLAADTNAHIHLVAHQRKPPSGKDDEPGNRYGAAGSANLSNLVDNVLFVFWNKKKDELRAKGEQVDESQGDGYLICDKQREYNGNGESEPGYKLFFDDRCLQFKGWKDAQKLGPDDWKMAKWN